MSQHPDIKWQLRRALPQENCKVCQQVYLPFSVQCFGQVQPYLLSKLSEGHVLGNSGAWGLESLTEGPGCLSLLQLLSFFPEEATAGLSWRERLRLG